MVVIALITYPLRMMMTLFPLTRAPALPRALISASQHRFGKEEQLKDPSVWTAFSHKNRRDPQYWTLLH
ncbi:unnamed protein product [Arctogadus glacialis]